MTLSQALLVLIAACVAAWGMAPAVAADPKAGAIAAGIVALLAYLMRRSSRVVQDAPAPVWRCVIASLTITAVLHSAYRGLVALNASLDVMLGAFVLMQALPLLLVAIAHGVGPARAVRVLAFWTHRGRGPELLACVWACYVALWTLWCVTILPLSAEPGTWR